ncbi:MAG: ribosomal protein S18-alanine N-acetyltransferase [Armatimonadetes bacterium]|nr:ribosomal protein S18-alanine N-acetyltransferase [Armatimonadota bacterium]
MKIEICKMQIKDLQKVLDIEKELFSEPWSAKMFVEKIINHESYVLQKSDEQEIIGYICGWKINDEFEITNLGIRKQFQRQGFGKILVEHLIKKVKNENCKIFFLEVRENNFAAQKLYEKLGFKVIGIREEYYNNPKENAVVMRLRLTENDSIYD